MSITEVNLAGGVPCWSTEEEPHPPCRGRGFQPRFRPVCGPLLRGKHSGSCSPRPHLLRPRVSAELLLLPSWGRPGRLGPWPSGAGRRLDAGLCRQLFTVLPILLGPAAGPPSRGPQGLDAPWMRACVASPSPSCLSSRGPQQPTAPPRHPSRGNCLLLRLFCTSFMLNEAKYPLHF